MAPFYLARFPVTNAEYACFIQAGGYDTEHYWTPTGWQWRQGKGESSGPVEDLLQLYQYYRQDPAAIAQWLKEGRLTPEDANTWRALIGLSEEEARQRFSEMYPLQPHDRPYYWDDPAYNAPNQPVVGVTWYEAMAYCAWLQAQLAASRAAVLPLRGWHGRHCWPMARGRCACPQRRSGSGRLAGQSTGAIPGAIRFSEERANTLDGRIMAPSPVGAFPAGMAACGALDMSGNVWEWTHSLYQGYPYRTDDGREDRFAAGRRTLRGGAWNNHHRDARVSYRNHDHPDDFSNGIGVRVVVGPVLLSSAS